MKNVMIGFVNMLRFVFMVLLFGLATVRGADAPVALLPTPPRPDSELGPTRVQYTVWIADIARIDSVAQTFSANVMLVLRWHDSKLKHDGPGARQYALKDVWHPPILIANETGDAKRSLPEVLDVAPDGMVTMRQRYISSYTHPMDLRSFPFDEADFRVDVVVLGHRNTDLIFEPDPSGVGAGLVNGIGHSSRFTLQDWTVLSTSAGARPYGIGPGLELAGFSFGFKAARNAKYFAIKVILPLLLIVMMSWSVFWIEPSETGPQFSIAMTSMLTLIAYRFAIETNIPKLPYLTRLDAFILASTALVFLTLMEVVAVSKFAKHDRLQLASTIDRHCRWIFPLIFTAATAIILFQ